MGMMHQRLIAGLITTINVSCDKARTLLRVMYLVASSVHKNKIRSTHFLFESPSKKPQVEAACQQGPCCTAFSAAFAAYCAKFPNYLEKSRQVCAMQLSAVSEARKEGNLQ
jgi:hypothetical protein